jgi:hypothetical protein
LQRRPSLYREIASSTWLSYLKIFREGRESYIVGCIRAQAIVKVGGAIKQRISC